MYADLLENTKAHHGVYRVKVYAPGLESNEWKGKTSLFGVEVHF